LGFRQPAKRDSVLCEPSPETKAEVSRLFPSIMATEHPLLDGWTGTPTTGRPVSSRKNMHQSCSNGLSLNTACLLEEGVMWSIAELETGHGYGSDEVGTG